MKAKSQNKSLLIRMILVGLLIVSASYGQQDAQYTQYMYNTISVNPAYAGSKEGFSATALYRTQWVGFDGAPETQTLNFHTPIGYSGLGIGVSFVNDAIGPTSESFFDIDFSYIISTGTYGQLGFGLKASAQLLDIRFSELTQDVTQGVDSDLQQNIDKRFSPNIGAGIYYFSEQFYAGISVPRILETEHFEASDLSTAKEQMNWYFMSGYVWDLAPTLKFKPALLTKWTQGAPLQIDVSANFMFNDKFIIGSAYRWDATFSGMLGFYLSDQLLLGLAYDREITNLGATTFNNGSFEVILRYDLFVPDYRKMRSPRFF